MKIKKYCGKAISDLFFNKAKQVIVKFTEEPNEIGGIAFRDYIILGDTGEAYRLSNQAIETLYVYPTWFNVSDEITGAPTDEVKTIDF